MHIIDRKELKAWAAVHCRLNSANRKAIAWRLRLRVLWYHLLRYFRPGQTPFPVRLGLVHALATAIVLILLPPPPETPIVAIPIVWAASLGTASLALSALHTVTGSHI